MVMYEPKDPYETSRRNFLKGGIGVAMAAAAGGVAGYGIAAVDGHGSDGIVAASPGQQQNPTPTPMSNDDMARFRNRNVGFV
ncbi:MAG: twin-arginine translocation signal domain-containing protein, partial [Chloroflexota bacterium]